MQARQAEDSSCHTLAGVQQRHCQPLSKLMTEGCIWEALGLSMPMCVLWTKQSLHAAGSRGKSVRTGTVKFLAVLHRVMSVSIKECFLLLFNKSIPTFMQSIQ